mmetsp:Transcript_6058/g.22161  ORF Transcript_6058/g.22161 Transcript_6058/m.22161 type:complete len:263 (-) Transcript_6058:7-795(-)
MPSVIVVNAPPTQPANSSSASLASTASFSCAPSSIRRMLSASGPTVSLQYSAVLTMRHRHLTSSTSASSPSGPALPDGCFFTSFKIFPAASARARNPAAYFRNTRENTPCNASSGFPRVKFEHRLNTFLMLMNTCPADARTSPAAAPPNDTDLVWLLMLCRMLFSFGVRFPHVSSATSWSTNSNSWRSSSSTYAPMWSSKHVLMTPRKLALATAAAAESIGSARPPRCSEISFALRRASYLARTSPALAPSSPSYASSSSSS